MPLPIEAFKFIFILMACIKNFTRFNLTVHNPDVCGARSIWNVEDLLRRCNSATQPHILYALSFEP